MAAPLFSNVYLETVEEAQNAREEPDEAGYAGCRPSGTGIRARAIRQSLETVFSHTITTKDWILQLQHP